MSSDRIDTHHGLRAGGWSKSPPARRRGGIVPPDEIAERRVRSSELANIETKVWSADVLPFDDAAFDSVSVRLGYMFFPDLAEATSLITRRWP